MDPRDAQDCLAILAVCKILRTVQESRRRRGRGPTNHLWKNRRSQGDGYHLLLEMQYFAPKMFFKYTRMNYERFEYLLGLIAPYVMKENRGTTIPPVQRLAMTLRYLACGDDQTSLAFQYRCGFSTVSVIIREVLSVLVHVLHRLCVAEPQSKRAWKSISQRFHDRWNLPHTLGAIDGRHMQVIAPKASGSKYFNYKKTFSIVLLAVADADYTFIVADVGAEGSQNDASILNASPFWKRVKEGKMHIPESDYLPNSNRQMNYFFAGDGIFQLQTDLMKPYAVRKLSLEDAIFNYRLSRARRVVENAFGILVARWRIFRAPICTGVENAESIVLATICLHNFIMRSRELEAVEEYNPPLFADHEDDDGNIVNGQWRNVVVNEEGALAPLQPVARRPPLRATQMRKVLTEYLNQEGAVEWQERSVRKGFWGSHITADIEEVQAARLDEENVDDEVEAALEEDASDAE